MEFQKFEKIPRLSRDIVITEKIDGTNGQIYIYDSNIIFPNTSIEKIPSDEFINNYSLYENNGVHMFAGSRKKWLDISSKGDNYGFAKWVQANAKELIKLDEGRHYGEWWGKGIQRGYNMEEKVFSLFNVGRWGDIDTKFYEDDKRQCCPTCCRVVPILYSGMFDTNKIYEQIVLLDWYGSMVSKGFKNPEGIIIYHTASGKMFKKTIKNDEKWKGNNNV